MSPATGWTLRSRWGRCEALPARWRPTTDPRPCLRPWTWFLCSTVKEPLATAAAVVIDPAARTLRYCLAGHPPPLLRGPDGTVSLLDEATGVLLGLETHNRPEEVVTFAPGSSVVLFTDGLVERRDETFDAGIARLATALKAAVTPARHRQPLSSSPSRITTATTT